MTPGALNGASSLERGVLDGGRWGSGLGRLIGVCVGGVLHEGCVDVSYE